MPDTDTLIQHYLEGTLTTAEAEELHELLQTQPELGERLLQVLRGHPMEVGGEHLTVSLSAGVAAYPENANGASPLLEQADQALLLAKQQGKGRVVVAEP